jgi:uncharacterized membrane-anchored protein YhcB (DUF1043 family)
MSTNAWWVLVGGMLVIGVIAGAWVTLRLARKRLAEQLRSAEARSQAELEQSRNSFKRQLAAIAAEPRAALERAEDRLKTAYAELDRLRGHPSPDTGSAELSDGFAATRPMRDRM